MYIRGGCCGQAAAESGGGVCVVECGADGDTASEAASARPHARLEVKAPRARRQSGWIAAASRPSPSDGVNERGGRLPDPLCDAHREIHVGQPSSSQIGQSAGRAVEFHG